MVLRRRVIGTRSSRAALARGPRRPRPARAAAFAGARFERRQHVALGDAAVLAGAGDARTGRCRFLRRYAGPTAWRARRCGCCRCGLAGCRRGQAAAGLGASALRRGSGLAAAGAALPALPSAMAPRTRADLHGGAGLDGDGFDRAVGGRGHFHRHLVGLQLQQRLVAGDRVAFLLEPAEMVASVTDSPIAGTLISMVIGSSSATPLQRQSARSRKAAVRQCAASSGRRRWRHIRAVPT